MTRRARGSGSPTPPARQADQRRRQERAYQLWLAGLSYQEIADTPDGERNGRRLYASKGAAYNAVKVAVERRAGARTTDDMRQQAYERYERLIRSLWPDAIRGNMWAHDRIGSHMRDQADLVGTKAPRRQQVEVITESAIDAEIERLVADMTARGVPVDELELEERP